MKKGLSVIITACLVVFISIIISSKTYLAFASNGPLCTQSEKWEYVIDNAYRVADEYAMAQYPRSTFIRPRIEKYFKFCKQPEGDFKGKHLLIITNKHQAGTSIAVLAPLFDVNKSSQNLDYEKSLWKVIRAEFNGRLYGGSDQVKASCIQDELNSKSTVNDPAQENVNLTKGNQTEIVTSGFLDIGLHYKLSKNTPVWQKDNPDFYGSLQHLPPGSVINIKGRYKEGFSTEYKIESTLPTGSPISGWISITALIGQDLEVVAP